MRNKPILIVRNTPLLLHWRNNIIPNIIVLGNISLSKSRFCGFFIIFKWILILKHLCHRYIFRIWHKEFGMGMWRKIVNLWGSNFNDCAWLNRGLKNQGKKYYLLCERSRKKEVIMTGNKIFWKINLKNIKIIIMFGKCTTFFISRRFEKFIGAFYHLIKVFL